MVIAFVESYDTIINDVNSNKYNFSDISKYISSTTAFKMFKFKRESFRKGYFFNEIFFFQGTTSFRAFFITI